MFKLSVLLVGNILTCNITRDVCSLLQINNMCVFVSVMV